MKVVSSHTGEGHLPPLRISVGYFEPTSECHDLRQECASTIRGDTKKCTHATALYCIILTSRIKSGAKPNDQLELFEDSNDSVDVPTVPTVAVTVKPASDPAASTWFLRASTLEGSVKTVVSTFALA